MAERRAVRRRTDDDERDEGTRGRDDGERSSGTSRSSRRRDAELTAAEAAQEGLQQITELTGKQAEGVTGVEPAEDGWVVGVEVVEDRRIPSSSDILAIYEIEVDPDGALMSYRRVKRYARGRGDSEDG